MLDMGTGSGAIAIALARRRPSWHITASDVSKAALKLLHSNAKRHAVKLSFVQSDLFEASLVPLISSLLTCRMLLTMLRFQLKLQWSHRWQSMAVPTA